MSAVNTESIPPPHTNGVIEDGYDEDDKSKNRPADIDADMREMERRKRVELIMNSRLFREELERIIETQIKAGNNSAGLLEQISDMVGSRYSGINSNLFRNTSCAVPINDIRGVEAMGYAKGEKILRCKLAALFRLIDLYGWSQGIYNHVTARLSQKEEHFLVNPYGLLYSEITASSLVKVDMQGNVIESGTTNFSVNVHGFQLHAAIYAARPDLKCIVHLHTPSVLAVSSLKDGLLPICQEAAVIGDVSHHPYTGIPNEPEERDKIARNLGPNNKVIFLNNHGALCCGETIEETFFYAYNTVNACETQLKVLPLGKDNLILLSDETRKAMYDASRKVPESVAPPVSNLPAAAATAAEKRWRIGGLEFEAIMRMLDNAGFRTGYVYRQPLIKGELPRPRNDVEVPPAVSSLGYLFEEEELYKGQWRRHYGGKGSDRIRWLNSPNVYQKVEILETGTSDPKKITKWVDANNEEWVADGSPSHTSTPVKIENALQFVPKNTNPKEFKKLQQQIKDNRRADKITSGPQSHILEGVSWEEAKKLQDANISGTSDQVILVGAASKGIIQREYQHNATVYKTPYAKNPFDAVTDEELENYKKDITRKQRGDSYYDEDESDALSSSLPPSGKRNTAGITSETEDESLTHEMRVIQIETTTVPKASQAEVVLSDDKANRKVSKNQAATKAFIRDYFDKANRIEKFIVRIWEVKKSRPIFLGSYLPSNVVRLRETDVKNVCRKIADELKTRFAGGDVFGRSVRPNIPVESPPRFTDVSLKSCSFDSSETEITTWIEIPLRERSRTSPESWHDFSSDPNTEDEDEREWGSDGELKRPFSLSSLSSCIGQEYENPENELTTSAITVSDDTSRDDITVILKEDDQECTLEPDKMESSDSSLSSSIIDDDEDEPFSDSNTYSCLSDVEYDFYTLDKSAEEAVTSFGDRNTKFKPQLTVIYEEMVDTKCSLKSILDLPTVERSDTPDTYVIDDQDELDIASEEIRAAIEKCALFADAILNRVRPFKAEQIDTENSPAIPAPDADSDAHTISDTSLISCMADSAEDLGALKNELDTNDESEKVADSGILMEMETMTYSSDGECTDVRAWSEMVAEKSTRAGSSGSDEGLEAFWVTQIEKIFDADIDEWYIERLFDDPDLLRIDKTLKETLDVPRDLVDDQQSIETDLKDEKSNDDGFYDAEGKIDNVSESKFEDDEKNSESGNDDVFRDQYGDEYLDTECENESTPDVNIEESPATENENRRLPVSRPEPESNENDVSDPRSEREEDSEPETKCETSQNHQIPVHSDDERGFSDSKRESNDDLVSGCENHPENSDRENFTRSEDERPFNVSKREYQFEPEFHNYDVLAHENEPEPESNDDKVSDVEYSIHDTPFDFENDLQCDQSNREESQSDYNAGDASDSDTRSENEAPVSDTTHEDVSELETEDKVFELENHSENFDHENFVRFEDECQVHDSKQELELESKPNDDEKSGCENRSENADRDNPVQLEDECRFDDSKEQNKSKPESNDDKGLSCTADLENFTQSRDGSRFDDSKRELESECESNDDKDSGSENCSQNSDQENSVQSEDESRFDDSEEENESKPESNDDKGLSCTTDLENFTQSRDGGRFDDSKRELESECESNDDKDSGSENCSQNSDQENSVQSEDESRFDDSKEENESKPESNDDKGLSRTNDSENSDQDNFVQSEDEGRFHDSKLELESESESNDDKGSGSKNNSQNPDLKTSDQPENESRFHDSKEENESKPESNDDKGLSRTNDSENSDQDNFVQSEDKGRFHDSKLELESECESNDDKDSGSENCSQNSDQENSVRSEDESRFDDSKEENESKPESNDDKDLSRTNDSENSHHDSSVRSEDERRFHDSKQELESESKLNDDEDSSSENRYENSHHDNSVRSEDERRFHDSKPELESNDDKDSGSENRSENCDQENSVHSEDESRFYDSREENESKRESNDDKVSDSTEESRPSNLETSTNVENEPRIPAIPSSSDEADSITEELYDDANSSQNGEPVGHDIDNECTAETNDLSCHRDIVSHSVTENESRSCEFNSTPDNELSMADDAICTSTPQFDSRTDEERSENTESSVRDPPSSCDIYLECVAEITDGYGDETSNQTSPDDSVETVFHSNDVIPGTPEDRFQVTDSHVPEVETKQRDTTTSTNCSCHDGKEISAVHCEICKFLEENKPAVDGDLFDIADSFFVRVVAGYDELPYGRDASFDRIEEIKEIFGQSMLDDLDVYEGCETKRTLDKKRTSVDGVEEEYFSVDDDECLRRDCNLREAVCGDRTCSLVEIADNEEEGFRSVERGGGDVLPDLSMLMEWNGVKCSIRDEVMLGEYEAESRVDDVIDVRPNDSANCALGITYDLGMAANVVENTRPSTSIADTVDVDVGYHESATTTVRSGVKNALNDPPTFSDEKKFSRMETGVDDSAQRDSKLRCGEKSPTNVSDSTTEGTDGKTPSAKPNDSRRRTNRKTRNKKNASGETKFERERDLKEVSVKFSLSIAWDDKCPSSDSKSSSYDDSLNSSKSISDEARNRDRNNNRCSFAELLNDFKVNYPKFVLFDDFSPKVRIRTGRRKRGVSKSGLHITPESNPSSPESPSGRYLRYSDVNCNISVRDASKLKNNNTNSTKTCKTSPSRRKTGAGVRAKVNTSTPVLNTQIVDKESLLDNLTSMTLSPIISSLEEFEFLESLLQSQT